MDKRDRQALVDIRGVLFRRLYPDLPWRAMAGMRDVLIHACDQVDLEEVWVAYQRFVEIRRQIDGILNHS